MVLKPGYSNNVGDWRVLKGRKHKLKMMRMYFISAHNTVESSEMVNAATYSPYLIISLWAYLGIVLLFVVTCTHGPKMKRQYRFVQKGVRFKTTSSKGSR